MMQQYLQTKEEYKDCILFYRLGDFYEMFFEDAELVSKELELTLTGKNCGMEERAPTDTRLPSASRWKIRSWQRDWSSARSSGS